MEPGGLWWTNVLNSALSPQRQRPDTWPEHQDPVSYMAGAGTQGWTELWLAGFIQSMVVVWLWLSPWFAYGTCCTLLGLWSSSAAAEGRDVEQGVRAVWGPSLHAGQQGQGCGCSALSRSGSEVGVLERGAEWQGGSRARLGSQGLRLYRKLPRADKTHEPHRPRAAPVLFFYG